MSLTMTGNDGKKYLTDCHHFKLCIYFKLKFGILFYNPV